MKFLTLKSKKYSTFNKIFWSVFGIGFAVLTLIFVLLASGMFGFMPDFEELENPKTLEASQVISSDSVVLDKYFKENRTLVDFKDISPHVTRALIATEDFRFQDHSGIDFLSLFRVLVKTVLFQRGNSGGGSTISQQLAKLLFPRKAFQSYHDILFRKFKEWIIAVKLEKRYTKREIIQMYLNKFDFLNLAVGIESAAQIYFNTTPKELTINQSAMLVGMVKNPSFYNPLRRPELTRIRRNVVLNQLEKYGYLTSILCDSLKLKGLELDVNLASFKRGPATYFRMFLSKYIRAGKPKRSNYRDFQVELYKHNLKLWNTDPLYGWCNKNKNQKGEPFNIYRDGLKIYTTIDSRMQKYAENAVKTHLKKNLQPSFERDMRNLLRPPFSDDIDAETVDKLLYNSVRRTGKCRELRREGLKMDSILKIFNKPIKAKVFTWEGPVDTVMSLMQQIIHHKKFLRSALYSVDPSNGHVMAYVGGADIEYFSYDMVTQGKRQAGSTIKPFLYTVAIQRGMSPCRKVPNTTVTFIVNDTIWQAKNSSKLENTGTDETLNWGLAHSVNTISAWLMKRYGPKPLCKLLKNLGVESKVPEVVSIFLGTADMTLQELTGAFSTFANKGVYSSPMYVTKIVDKYGNVISRFKSRGREVLSERVSRTMVDMLIDVVRQGTGARLMSTYREYGGLRDALIGGKTGTSQNHSDGIFVGLVPKLVTGIWTGGEERSIHFQHITQGQGANMALPIFGYYMNEIYADSTIGITKQDTFYLPMNYRKYSCNASWSVNPRLKEDDIQKFSDEEGDENDEESFDL